MKPIYTPSGAAKEYGDYAINIYTGCSHRCFYCYAPTVLHKDREAFHSHVEPRPDIYRATMVQLEKEQITGKTIHLCFTCDPYPTGYDTTMTRDIIKLIKNSGNHVQILTKGDGSRDFDLLDGGDWYGVTYAGYDPKEFTKSPVEEPGATSPYTRLDVLSTAKKRGINTWVSCEPVLFPCDVYALIALADFIDLFKIGKLNYHPSNIDWYEFGHKVEALCKQYGRNYYIKDSLRREMEAKP
jgi:DNA repair photolyase